MTMYCYNGLEYSCGELLSKYDSLHEMQEVAVESDIKYTNRSQDLHLRPLVLRSDLVITRELTLNETEF